MKFWMTILSVFCLLSCNNESVKKEDAVNDTSAFYQSNFEEMKAEADSAGQALKAAARNADTAR